MSWLSKTLGLDKLVHVGGLVPKVTAAVSGVETDVSVAVTKGASSLAAIHQLLTDPSNVDLDVAAIGTLREDAVAAIQAVDAAVELVKAV